MYEWSSVTSQLQCRKQAQVRLAVLGPVIAMLLDTLRSTWLASDTQQKPTSSKLSLHRLLTQFFLRLDTSLGATVGQEFNCQ
jgi:hypothetical protein